jgi:hypothetical protein
MAQDILVDLGEEFVVKNDLEGVSVDIGLYNDATDGLTDTSDISDISTEPGNANYSRQSTTLSVLDISGNWGAETATDISFDFSDVQPGDTEDVTVDTGFVVVNFQAEDTGDGSANDHLFGNFALTQDRQTREFDELQISAGDAEVTLD